MLEPQLLQGAVYKYRGPDNRFQKPKHTHPKTGGRGNKINGCADKPKTVYRAGRAASVFVFHGYE